MEKFNQNLSQFIDIIKKNYPSQKELIEKHYTFDKPCDILIKTWDLLKSIYF